MSGDIIGGKMNIGHHPIWHKITPLKKPAHLLRFFLAKIVASLFPRQVFVGITGSVGKTVTTLACQKVLSQKFVTLGTEPNLDPIFNIPITLLKLRPAIKKMVLEMGVEYPGEMDFYLSLVKPAAAIITKISYTHSEFLGGLEQITEEKSKLIKQLPLEGVAILNWDDVRLRKLALETEASVLFFGTDQTHCDVWADNIAVKDFKTKFQLNKGVERVEVEYQPVGKHQIYSALAAATLGVSCGLSLISIKRGLEEVETPLHRLQALEGVGGFYVLDDTYNSSPIAVEAALDVLCELPARRRIVVLGEMKELGKFSEKLHRQIAERLYKERVDLVFLGGGEVEFIYDELLKLGFLPERMEKGLSNSQMVSKILKNAGKGDVVLVKGSRALRLEEVVRRVIRQK